MIRKHELFKKLDDIVEEFRVNMEFERDAKPSQSAQEYAQALSLQTFYAIDALKDAIKSVVDTLPDN